MAADTWRSWVAGLVNLRFFSGEGMGLLGCNPNLCLRTALCALTAITVTPEMRAPFASLVSADLRQYLNRTLADNSVAWNYEDNWSGKPPIMAGKMSLAAKMGQTGGDDEDGEDEEE